MTEALGSIAVYFVEKLYFDALTIFYYLHAKKVMKNTQLRTFFAILSLFFVCV